MKWSVEYGTFIHNVIQLRFEDYTFVNTSQLSFFFYVQVPLLTTVKTTSCALPVVSGSVWILALMNYVVYRNSSVRT